jgi:hypothetical protein
MMLRSKFLVLAAGLLSVECAPPSHSSPPDHAAEAGVYAALVDSLFTRPVPDTLLVAESTLVFRAPHGGVPEWHAQFDSIPKALPPALETISLVRRSSRSLPLHRPIRLVTRAELREIFVRGRLDSWDEFYRRYPRQRNLLQFSPVAFSTDNRDALVYYEYHCGFECGGGEIVWLVRTERGQWRVRKMVEVWVS